MESSVRHPYPLVAAVAALSAPVFVEAFTMPRLHRPLQPPSVASRIASSSSLGVSIGLGPENDPPTQETDEGTNEAKTGSDGGAAADAAVPDDSDWYDPARVIRGEDGLPKPHITDMEPYRKERMSNSDRDADAWFGAMLDGPGPSFLGKIADGHKVRLTTPVELVDEPVLDYDDEEWTPYVTRRLPTTPLYPAYGLETYGLPIPRRGAEAWRHFDLNGLIAVDYSGRPGGTGSDVEFESDEERDATVEALKDKGAWLDDDKCAGRLVYVNGRFCPALSMQTPDVRNLDSSAFGEDGDLSEEVVGYLTRLPDGFTDELAAEVPDSDRGPITSQEKLSGPDHCVGKATSQFAINNQQGTAAFAALNSVKAGCVAYVEGNGEEKRPVLIVNAQTPSGGGGEAEDGKGVAFHPRTLAVANEGSVMSLVQMCVDLDDSSADASPRATFMNGYTQIFVKENANMTHSFLEESGGMVTGRTEMSNDELAKMAPDLAENPRDVEARRPALRNSNFQAIDAHVIGDNGSYSSSLMEIGGNGRSRIAISANLLRPGAFAAVNGFALSGGAQRADMRTNIHHMAQGTTSRQEQRNMVGGRSTASFRGRIRVEQSAQQTDSNQLSRTILLSDNARIWATPSLEIIADDVQCTHGATVSDLSEEELFYLRSRGLDVTTSRNMLMYAFVEGIGNSVDETIAGGFDDPKGLRSRIIQRLENVVPTGERTLVGGEFQSV